MMVGDNYGGMGVPELQRVYEKVYGTTKNLAEQLQNRKYSDVNIPEDKGELIKLIRLNESLIALMKATGTRQ